ncbi:MAG: transposase [Solirubrobacteraceae bacterium]
MSIRGAFRVVGLALATPSGSRSGWANSTTVRPSATLALVRRFRRDGEPVTPQYSRAYVPAASPTGLSAYLGIVPSEHTTGQQRRLGSITKAGSTHARRLLVEAAHHYRRGPVVGEALERRQRGQAPEIINVSWRAQRRLNARWRQLRDARRKPAGIVAVAIARELTAYCWEIATCTTTTPEPTPTPTTRKRLTNSR